MTSYLVKKFPMENLFCAHFCSFSFIGVSSLQNIETRQIQQCGEELDKKNGDCDETHTININCFVLTNTFWKNKYLYS